MAQKEKSEAVLFYKALIRDETGKTVEDTTVPGGKTVSNDASATVSSTQIYQIHYSHSVDVGQCVSMGCMLSAATTNPGEAAVPLLPGRTVYKSGVKIEARNETNFVKGKYIENVKED